MGLLFLSSAACCLERFPEPQLTSTVGRFRALNIHCAVSAPTTHMHLIDIAVRASQHALFLDHFTFDSIQHSTTTHKPKATTQKRHILGVSTPHQ